MLKLARLTFCAVSLMIAETTAFAQPPPASPQRGQREFETTVNARELWQDSGVFLEAGQRVTITASGTWGDAAGMTDVNGRASQVLFGRRNEIALPSAPVMLLIAKIGPQGTPFRVGLRTEHVAQRGGNLFMMANDRFDTLHDNQGTLRVAVLFQ
jgi:hypothetical protein